MKSLVIFAALLLFECFVHGRNTWETLRRADLTARELEEIREEKLSKTSIIAYDKFQMSDEDTDAEISRIIEKCNELGCPCEVTKLGKVGVLEVTWTCVNHPSVHELGLDSTKEIGAEDEFVELNDSPFPTDPRISDQWAFKDLDNNADINIAEGWEEYLSDAQGGNPNGPSVVVAVIDTGVDYNHPDLKDVMWTNPGEIAGDGIDNDGNGIIDDVYGADFYWSTSGSGDPIDTQSHGTHCAGIIAATPNNGEGIAGVASFTKGKVKIMAVKAFWGRRTHGSALFASLNYAIENGAKISSNSWGSDKSISSGLELIWDAVLRNNLDHLFVAAAGNENRFINNDFKPLACGLNEPNLLCVAASTVDDERWLDYPWLGSNYGPEYVHVFAPGARILSTVPDNRYASYSGTSMACPMVSGLAALIMTMRDGMSAEEVRRVIEANVRVKAEYSTYVSTSGLIDVGATIKALKGPDGNETINGGWGEWSQWTDCPVSCGGGTQGRTRVCDSPAPQFGGDDCTIDGSLDMETQPCNENPCPINGGWGEWGDWVECPVSCGGADQERTRVCDNPAPQFEGDDCTVDGSSDSETQRCNENPCPDLCFVVKTVTQSWGNEITWNIGGTCDSRDGYQNNIVDTQQCCVKGYDEFVVTCKDSYGDGWHGGYLAINGKKYCEDFFTGKEFLDELSADDLDGSDEPELCGDIKIRTEYYGNENSYSIGTCASKQLPYTNYYDYVEECCLQPGTYTLDCKCTYGDGWHGGYVEIAGVRYCDDFLFGSNQTVAVEWGS